MGRRQCGGRRAWIFGTVLLAGLRALTAPTAETAVAPAESQAFLLTENVVSAWLVAGPFVQPQPELEKAALGRTPPPAALPWRLVNLTPGAALASESRRTPPPDTPAAGIHYAFTLLRASPSAECRLECGPGVTGVWTPAGSLSPAAAPKLSLGSTASLPLLVRLADNCLPEPERQPHLTEAAAQPTAVLSSLLPPDFLPAADFAQLASRSFRLRFHPPFVDRASSLRLELLPLRGAAFCPGNFAGRLSVAPQTAPTQIDFGPIVDFFRTGWTGTCAPPAEKDGRLTVEMELLAEGRPFARVQASAYREAGLVSRIETLAAGFAAASEDKFGNVALARLTLDQLELLRAGRQRRTEYYGLALQSVLERLTACRRAESESRDLLAGRTGIQESAYLCASDGSAQPYRYFLPEQVAAPSAGWPLIVMLHGYVPTYNKLDWFEIDSRLAAAMENLGCALLAPFGRSNTDFLTIGEVDVLRSIEELAKRVKLDRRRIYLAGYSMGGSGVWTMLTHYPDRFAGAQIWSGRRDLYYWHAAVLAAAGVSRETLPFYKRALIDADNPYTLWQTLRDTPIRAVHPVDDNLVKPGHSTRIFERLRPPAGRMRLVTPGPGLDHWYFSAEVSDPNAYRWLLAERLERPAIIRHATVTLKYAGKFGLAANLIPRWGEIASFAVTPLPARKAFALQLADNVMSFQLLPEGSEFYGQSNLNSWAWEWAQNALPADHQPLPLPVGAIRSGADNGYARFKTAEICGPVKEAFNGPFLLVQGTGGGSDAQQQLKQTADRFAADWLDFAKGRARRKIDREITAEDESAFNLVLFGSPRTNSVLAKIGARLPLKFLPAGYAIGEHEVQGENLGLAVVYPHPDHPQRYVVVLDGLYYGLNLPINHKWDLVPDFIIFSDRSCPYDGTNEAELAGFFDMRWQVDEHTLYRRTTK